MPGCPWTTRLEERRRIGVEEQGALRLLAEERGRAGGGDGSAKHVVDGLGLPLFRRHAHHFLRGAEGGDGEGEGVRGHGFEGGEVPFLDLLHFAGVVELHEFDPVRIVEAGDGRIIEGDVAIFADAEAAEIDGLRLEERGVPGDFVERQVALAVEVMELPGFDEEFHAFAHITTEARRVIAGDSEVFVHVEQGDLGPIDAAGLDESFEEPDLGITGGEDGGGGTLAGDDLGQVVSDLGRHGGGHVVLIAVDANGESVGLELLNRRAHVCLVETSLDGTATLGGRGIRGKSGRCLREERRDRKVGGTTGLSLSGNRRNHPAALFHAARSVARARGAARFQVGR